MTSRARLLWILFLFLVWCGPHLSSALGCPMCSESLPGGDGPVVETVPSDGEPSAPRTGRLAEGFYYSIVLMLAVPFSMMAGLIGVFYWKLRHPANILRGSSRAGVS